MKCKITKGKSVKRLKEDEDIVKCKIRRGKTVRGRREAKMRGTLALLLLCKTSLQLNLGKYFPEINNILYQPLLFTAVLEIIMQCAKTWCICTKGGL